MSSRRRKGKPELRRRGEAREEEAAGVAAEVAVDGIFSGDGGSGARVLAEGLGFRVGASGRESEERLWFFFF